jgi:thermitase
MRRAAPVQITHLSSDRGWKGWKGWNETGAGNSGVNSDLQPAYPASFDLPNIISVAAIDHSDNLPYFSNRGVVTVDLAAPGVAVLSTVLGGGYASYSGTSMATPHVTGTAALALGLHPEWDHVRLKHQILATTRAVPALAGNVLTFFAEPQGLVKV